MRDSSDALDAVLGRASAAGVEILPLWQHVVGAPTQPGLVVGYGAIATERIEEGLRRLRRCFEDKTGHLCDAVADAGAASRS